MTLIDTLLEWRRRDQDLRQNSRDYAAWLEFDSAATAWLKAEIAARGWPVEVGDDGAASAWLIAQHSPDLEFQKVCLELMRGLPESQVNAQHVAYLHDRICIREGRPQRYGTQSRPRAGSQMWELFPLEDVHTVNLERERLGLAPLEAHLLASSDMAKPV